MLKKLFKQNFVFGIILIGLVGYSMFMDNEHLLEMAGFLFLATVVSAVLSTSLFFMVPAKYAAVAFGFMFAAVGLKFLLSSVFFGIGLVHVHDDYLNTYILFGFIALLVYKLSLVFFVNDEK
jgi:hypothetical protein